MEEKIPDGKSVCIPKRKLSRLKQYKKQEHKIAISPFIKGEEVTDTNRTTKEKQVQEDFQ